MTADRVSFLWSLGVVGVLTALIVVALAYRRRWLKVQAKAQHWFDCYNDLARVLEQQASDANWKKGHTHIRPLGAKAFLDDLFKPVQHSPVALTIHAADETLAAASLIQQTRVSR